MSVQVHLQIYSVTLTLATYALLEAYFRRPEGHRLAMECNGQYVGGAQCVERFPSSSTQEAGSTYLYQWLTTTKRPPTPRMTKQELYEAAIIEGVPPPASQHDERKSPRAALGTLMSPRVHDNNVKTPRPNSHIRKHLLVPPPYVPDSPAVHNEVKRLYAVVTEQTPILLQLFNFRFTPPRRLHQRLTYADFQAAYRRTLAQSVLLSEPAAATRASLLKKRLSKRKLQEQEQKRLQEQERERSMLVCRLEREVHTGCLLTVHFSLSEAQGMAYMRRVELLVQNARTTLNLQEEE